MRFNVYRERFFGAVRLSAQSAFVETFTQMSILMQFEYVTVCKRLVTPITRVWSLTYIFKSTIKLNFKYLFRMMWPFHDHPTKVPV